MRTEPMGRLVCCSMFITILIIAFSGGKLLAQAEIDIQGLGNVISDGDSSPSSVDGTDFGSTGVTGGFIDRTFAISNTGISLLSLTGGGALVNITGSESSDFAVISPPESNIAQGGGSTDFTVRFDPSALGSRLATISIDNSDTDENPYNFDIKGTGTDIVYYELSVSASGTGSGMVSSSPPGINCGTACLSSYASGDTITLTATPDSGSTFIGWSGGGCSGAGDCTISISEDTGMIAIFNKMQAVPDNNNSVTGINDEESDNIRDDLGCFLSVFFRS